MYREKNVYLKYKCTRNDKTSNKKSRNIRVGNPLIRVSC